MKILIAFSCLVATIVARPEAGYSYSQPAALVQQQAAYVQQPAELVQQSATLVQQPAALVQQPAVYQAPPVFQAQASYQVQPVYQAQQTYQTPIVTSTIHKHVYIHVPPPDHEDIAEQHALQPVINHQKHYKIIFIKAPTAPSISQQIFQQQQSINEEKTIVYVLVKKPETLTEIQQAQTQVIFNRYWNCTIVIVSSILEAAIFNHTKFWFFCRWNSFESHRNRKYISSNTKPRKIIFTLLQLLPLLYKSRFQPHRFHSKRHRQPLKPTTAMSFPLNRELLSNHRPFTDQQLPEVKINCD